MHEDEESSGERADPIGIVICTGEISKHLEGEHVGRPGGRTIRIRDSGEFLTDIKREFGGGDEESVKVAEL